MTIHSLIALLCMTSAVVVLAGCGETNQENLQVWMLR